MPITLDGTLGVGTPGITLAGGAITANANQLNNSAEDVNSENRIINGDFGVWQRGTSSAAVGFVAADRWVNNFAGGTVTQARVAVNPGDQLGGVNLTAYLSQSVSGQTLAAHYANTHQKIEGVRSYAGQTITVMGWAIKSGGGAGNMVVEGEQIFGSGGSPSAAVTAISPTTLPLSGSSWQPFAVVMNVPSITGKTLGTNNNDFFNLNFWASAGSDWNARTNSLGLQTITVNLWGIHIRVGTWTAADTALYRPRDPGTELALCQRYYIKYDNLIVAPSTRTAGVDRASIGFPASMRAAPTVTSTINSGGGTLILQYVDQSGFTFGANNPTSACILNGYTADAEI